ncbi:MAG: hypothetical protein ACRD4D_02405 [Candidatus Acidiferrales bacterium]
MLEADPGADLRVYVVWLGVLSRLSPEALAGAARSASRRIDDPRVRHFLDPDYALAAPYRSILGLSHEGDDPAWDAFLLFDRAARWDQQPPAPADWMHQLGVGPPERRLDAAKLAESVRAALAVPAP